MATRNRTIIFNKYRDALKSIHVPAGASSSSFASSSLGGPVIELVGSSFLHPNSSSYVPLRTEDIGSSSGGALTVGLPPDWVDVSEEITADVQRTRSKMAELAKAHAKALMPSFSDAKEDQHQIEALTNEITHILKKSEKRLQNISAGGRSEDSNVRKNVQRSLATELQNLSVELRKKQSAYLKRLQLQKEGQDVVDLEIKIDGSRYKKDNDELDDIGFGENQMATLNRNEALTAERERETQQVAKSVNELAQIMKDLSVLVIDQGTVVDRIDFNIQNVAASVEDGYKQLQKAERAQKGGMATCVMVLVVMCSTMLLLLIIKEIFS